MKIGLALSGGGFRATVFHLGMLARLAEEGRLEDVSFISTVSGGSLAAGLIHAVNGLRWPSSEQYATAIAPAARDLLTTVDLQRELVRRGLLTFWRALDPRADDLSALLRKHWGISASLRDLPTSPRWMINATCYETGKNWRFERFRMGDYVFGYTHDTDLPLSDALAASAGFPGAIGALSLEASSRSWFRYVSRPPEALADPAAQQGSRTTPVAPLYPRVHLWDGGVYDNHGLEGLHDFVTGWRDSVEFLIVSDGAGRSKPEAYRPGVGALMRIITGIMMDQIRSLRSRAIVERLVNHEDQGAFLQIGNACQQVLEAAGKGAEVARICAACLPDEAAERAAALPTVIRKLTQDEYELLFRHGYEVADTTLHAYHPGEFGHVSYADSRWGSPPGRH